MFPNGGIYVRCNAKRAESYISYVTRRTARRQIQYFKVSPRDCKG